MITGNRYLDCLKTTILFCFIALQSGQPLHAQDSGWQDVFGGTNGLNDGVYALAAGETGDIYAGGYFTEAGGQPANYVARWTGTGWEALGEGVNYMVYALAMIGDDVYVGGAFTEAGGQEARYVSRWTGTNWEPLANTLSGWVYALAVSDAGDLYAGGAFTFTNASGEFVNHVARWTGTDWEPVGSSVDPTPNIDVYAMAFGLAGDLYVGGEIPSPFKASGTGEIKYLAHWTGSAWEALGSGVNGSVDALAVSETGEVYAGGGFLEAGGQPVNYVARWTGTEWGPLGGGVNSPVASISLSESGVFVGGTHTEAGGQPANRIARWTGTAWEALGSGVAPHDVVSLLLVGDDLYVGGDFAEAGGRPAGNLAIWTVSTPSAIDDPFPATPSKLVISSVFPNPLRDQATISFGLPAAGNVQIDVYDVLGRRVAQLLNEARPAGRQEVAWHAGNLPRGTYFIRLRVGSSAYTRAAMLVR